VKPLQFRDFAVGDFFIIVDDIELTPENRYRAKEGIKKLPAGAVGVVTGTTKEYMIVDVPPVGSYIFKDEQSNKLRLDPPSRYIKKSNEWEE
jgi:hypothetical protein